MVAKVEAEVESDDLDDATPSAAMAGEDLAKSMAAAAGGMPKNFRQQADMESFYRFVHENDLREEALVIFDEVRAGKAAVKAAKNRVKH